MKKKKPLPKPRDPFVQHMAKRPQGAHQKPYKTLRRKLKESLSKAAEETSIIFGNGKGIFA